MEPIIITIIQLLPNDQSFGKNLVQKNVEGTMKPLLVFTIFWSICLKALTQPVVVKYIIQDNSFDSLSFAKLAESTKILENVINSTDFKTKILGTQFTVGNFDLTSSQIFDLIISGKDNYKDKPADGSIDLRLSLFDKYLGYDNFGLTNMTTRVTSTHRCYVLYNDIKCYVSHLAHEYLHQIGFSDVRTWLFGTKTKSVPYKVGDIVDELIHNGEFCAAQHQTCRKN